LGLLEQIQCPHILMIAVQLQRFLKKIFNARIFRGPSGQESGEKKTHNSD
jgi:hypothetical protein